MEKSIITTGKTIDEAVETALAQLGLTRDDVTYQVISLPKSGFFGIGAVPAKVQVTYEAPDLKPAKPEKKEEPKADAAPKAEAAPRIALSSASRSKPKADAAPRTEKKPVEKKPEPKPEVKAAPAPKAEPKPEAPKAAPAPKAEKKPVEKKERAPKAPKAETAPKTEPKREYVPAAPGSNEEKIEQFIAGLLENMGSKAVPHCWAESENSYRVELTGEGLGFLIGRRGETLDAIQHLANYAVNRSVDGHVRINVDAECYREKREDSLRRYARKKAQQVLKNRRRTTLEPMNAYERHVIHAALQDMDNITTHSTGTEPNRRVVIEYVR